MIESEIFFLFVFQWSDFVEIHKIPVETCKMLANLADLLIIQFIFKIFFRIYRKKFFIHTHTHTHAWGKWTEWLGYIGLWIRPVTAYRKPFCYILEAFLSELKTNLEIQCLPSMMNHIDLAVKFEFCSSLPVLSRAGSWKFL